MKTTLGILGALGIGICIGLLIAPDKGAETRKRVADTLNDWADELKSIFQKTEEEVDKATEDLRAKARRVKSAAQQRASGMNESFES